MANMNEKGPDNNGSKTGRGLGKCVKIDGEKNPTYILGVGMGKRRKAGNIEILKH